VLIDRVYRILPREWDHLCLHALLRHHPALAFAPGCRTRGQLRLITFQVRLQCTVGVQMVLKLEEATFSYIASLLRFKGTLLRYYGAETYSVIKSLIINKDFCPGRL
jgi:hypothetical protein